MVQFSRSAQAQATRWTYDKLRHCFADKSVLNKNSTNDQIELKSNRMIFDGLASSQ